MPRALSLARRFSTLERRDADFSTAFFNLTYLGRVAFFTIGRSKIFRTILFNVLFELHAGIGILKWLRLVGRHSYRMLMYLTLYHLPTEGCVIFAAANIQPFSFENDKTRDADADNDNDDDDCISGTQIM